MIIIIQLIITNTYLVLYLIITQWRNADRYITQRIQWVLRSRS